MLVNGNPEPESGLLLGLLVVGLLTVASVLLFAALAGLVGHWTVNAFEWGWGLA